MLISKYTSFCKHENQLDYFRKREENYFACVHKSSKRLGDVSEINWVKKPLDFGKLIAFQVARWNRKILS